MLFPNFILLVYISSIIPQKQIFWNYAIRCQLYLMFLKLFYDEGHLSADRHLNLHESSTPGRSFHPAWLISMFFLSQRQDQRGTA